ncbi:ATP-dependent zinc protease family protein [Vibrio aphrogenes]|uniref:ATP-dependent zinc protease family protein n=1 Tax=Vibrio aphrogenes TaxID=1891186 RepID=UPI000B35A817|nr:ATP-dependent zinc protease [Vibrio aphrogenes]
MFRWLLIALLSCSFSTLAADKAQPVSQVTPQEITVATHTKSGDLVLGEKEWIYVKDLNRNILSRVDTGATSSSISAVDIKTYKKDGKNFVDFKLAHKKWESKTLTYPVTRWVEVVQSTTDKPSKSRPVVQLDVQVGDYKVKTDFTLADRTHLQYPVLLGRTFIDNVAVVDVSHKYIQPRVKIEKAAADTAQSDNAKTEK